MNEKITITVQKGQEEVAVRTGDFAIFAVSTTTTDEDGQVDQQLSGGAIGRAGKGDVATALASLVLSCEEDKPGIWVAFAEALSRLRRERAGKEVEGL